MVKHDTLHVGKTGRKSQIEQERVVTEVNQFGAQHVLCCALLLSILMEQRLNLGQATTSG